MQPIFLKRTGSTKQGISTILALALIPLSGLATDIYIPSLPDMVQKLNTTPASLQFTLAIFMISYGAGQLIIGGVLDSYGRYIPGLLSLFLFSMASFFIALTRSIEFIYFLRVIQGVTVATIVVSKRAYFIDLFSGEKLKHYTSLFSIIWSASPILAPFLGGYLQTSLGWQSNFIFLGCFGLLMLILEFIFSRETLLIFEPFRLRSILTIYQSMIKTKDFTVGILILGLSYSILMIFAMAGPFLIEQRLHFPPTMTGNCSLVSGVSFLAGGLLSKALMRKPFLKKIVIATIIQIIAAVGLILLTNKHSSLPTLIAYIIILHSLSGFTFNNLFSHCIMKFPHNAAKASGLVGGGFAIANAVFSYSVVGFLNIKSQPLLGAGYCTLASVILLLFVFTTWNKKDTKYTTPFQVE